MDAWANPGIINLARRSPPTPLVGLSALGVYSWFLLLPATVRLGLAWKHAWVAEVSYFLCLHSHLVVTGSPTEHTFPTPPPNLTLPHQTIMKVQIKSGKAAGLEQARISAILLLKRCKMVPDWPMACRRALTSLSSHRLTSYNVHVMNSWGWQLGEHGGVQANWPHLGGSNGEGDPIIAMIKMQ